MQQVNELFAQVDERRKVISTIVAAFVMDVGMICSIILRCI